MTRARLLITLSLALTLQVGCATGIQQTAVLPWVRGGWSFSGTDFIARDPSGTSMPVHVGSDSGRIQDIGTVTQILLAMDLPFMRASMAPALLGNNNVEFIQADLLYKHLIVDEPGRRWWLLAGLGAMILNTGVSFTTHPTQNTVIAGHNVTPDDTINYTARRDASGIYAALGAQVELTGWCHGYVEMLARLSHSESQYESITMPIGANGTTVDLTGANSNVTLDRQLQGSVTTNYTVPTFLLSVGVQFNLPSYHVTRRFVHWHAGDPAMDELPPEPETPPQEPVMPAEAVSPTAP